jgi:hypothetical protein
MLSNEVIAAGLMAAVMFLTPMTASAFGLLWVFDRAAESESHR